jgi:tyrosyl-tRNA synthetase
MNNNRLSTHLETINKHAVEVISQEELILKIEQSFKDKKPLRLKIGFDPTSRDIHLGHTVLLRKLRALQDLGHLVYLIIGDFTAKIGDPSGKITLRPVLSDKQIKSNASTYTRQVFKILNPKRTKVIYNSVWYRKMGLSQFLKLLSSYTVARILERDDFSQRLKENRPLSMLEVIYPLIQGYDSYQIKADIEFGGTDQKFNLIVGRNLQQAFGQSPQAIVTMPILVGLDGKNKMSKSLNNYIGITESPKDMFGKIMSISDEVMWEYFRLLTDIDIQTVKNIHPKEAKLKLATEIVSFYYSPRLALKAKKNFERVFSQKNIPEDLPIYKVREDSIDIIEVLSQAGLVASKNEARRLLNQGSISVSLNNTADLSVLKEQNISLPPEGLVFKVGKKRFLKVLSAK